MLKEVGYTDDIIDVWMQQKNQPTVLQDPKDFIEVPHSRQIRHKYATRPDSTHEPGMHVLLP